MTAMQFDTVNNLIDDLSYYDPVDEMLSRRDLQAPQWSIALTAIILLLILSIMIHVALNLYKSYTSFKITPSSKPTRHHAGTSSSPVKEVKSLGRIITSPDSTTAPDLPSPSYAPPSWKLMSWSGKSSVIKHTRRPRRPSIINQTTTAEPLNKAADSQKNVVLEIGEGDDSEYEDMDEKSSSNLVQSNLSDNNPAASDSATAKRHAVLVLTSPVADSVASETKSAPTKFGTSK